ncbi:SGNH hydrolase-type esterase domain-containing protein [Gautieria morchelliformis]|nr:SGNH hydrolase-type esterase domain-containing protein [Gautieria morchelliformis]
MALPSNVQFQGRWDLEGDDRYATHWCGSSLSFQTTSRSVTLQLGSLTVSRKNYHNVLWRFGSQSVIRTSLVKGKRAMVLTPSGAGAGSTHGGEVLLDVIVMLCDWGAILQILDITATDGRPILPPAVGSPVRPMLFIGDSLVSGFSPPFRGLVLPHGSFQAFGSVVVRTLRARGKDARLEMVAYPGLQLISTEHDKGMEDIFWDGMDGVSGWEQRSKDPPEDIFICIGANDRGWGVEKDEFLRTYKAFLVRLRDSYPNTLKRIHVISPFGLFKYPSEPEDRVAVFEPDVQHMVETLAESWRQSNPEGVELFHIATDGWIDKSHTCDGLHPNTEGHDKIGARLIECLDARGLV